MLFITLGLLAFVLLIIDGWPQLAGTPTDCADEDVPVIERLIDDWFEEYEKK